MDRWPEDPNAPKRIVDIMPCVVPVLMSRDQVLSVHLSGGSKLLAVSERMPPRVNYSRIPMPTRQAEREARLREWRDIERQAFE